MQSGDSRLFVLPADKDTVNVSEGNTISLEGVILQMPSGMRDSVTIGHPTNDEIYVYARSVSK